MPRITPQRREDAPEIEDVFERAEKALGFVPNSFYILARRPETARAFSRLAREVIGVPGTVPLALKRLVAHVSSLSAGCQYCAAHSAESAAAVDGVAPEKVAAAFDYERSPLFTDAERAALSLAQAAATVPNAVTDADFEALRKHFDDDQIVELVTVICLFGWLNRFNDTMATELEARPRAFAEANLAAAGWDIGKHGGDGSD